MSTPRQTLANRQNAQHSTGPVSQPGKARSAANSLRHGLTAKKIVIDSVEDKLIFEELAGGLREEFQPSTPHEHILVDTMIHARWTALRCIAQEKASYEAALGRAPLRDRCVSFMDEAYHEPHRRLFRATSRRELDSIHRYHTTAMRGYHRAVTTARSRNSPNTASSRPQPPKPRLPSNRKRSRNPSRNPRPPRNHSRIKRLPLQMASFRKMNITPSRPRIQN